MTDFSIFLDSNILIDYFLNGKFSEMIDSPKYSLFTSVICLFEICKVLKRLGKSEHDIIKSLHFMGECIRFIDVDQEIALSAFENSEKYSLPAADSMIYSSAKKLDLEFLTTDYDFHQLPGVKIVE